jgi:hypothetical protein
MNRKLVGSGLSDAGPIAFVGGPAPKSARGLAHSKMLARAFMVEYKDVMTGFG